MDGHYLNKADIFIENWINSSIKKNNSEKYFDIHIDDIDCTLIDKNLWVCSSIIFFKLIESKLTSKNYEFLLVISIQYHKNYLNSEYTLDFIKENLDLSPPSFYLYQKGLKEIQYTIDEANFLLELSKQIGYNSYVKTNRTNHLIDGIIYVTSIKFIDEKI